MQNDRVIRGISLSRIKFSWNLVSSVSVKASLAPPHQLVSCLTLPSPSQKCSLHDVIQLGDPHQS